ncbi:MAG: S9 family peptidase [Asticcacaulis sp.]
MDRRTILFSGTAAGLALGLPGLGQAAAKTKGSMTQGKTMPKPPVAPKIPHKTEQLGRVRVDDYAWMKDENWQKVMRDPKILRADIRQHLEAENAYSKAVLAETEALQATMFDEMKGRIKEDDASVPSPDGTWEYYTRFEKGAQQAIHARRPRGGGAEQILINEDVLAKDHSFYSVNDAGHTPDHKYYVWTADTQGSEYYTLFIKDLAADKVIGTIDGTYGAFTVTPDSQWLFWIWRDENARPAKIFRRPLLGGKDELVYEEKDPGFFIGVGVTAADRFIEISAQNQETSETWLIPTKTPTAAPVLVEARKTGVIYNLQDWGDRFVVHTNEDAEDFKLMWADADMPRRASWKPWIAHRPGVFVTGTLAFETFLVRAEKENANDRIVITQKSDLSEHAIAFDEEAYVLGLMGGFEYKTETLRFRYASPTTPNQTFDYDMAKRTRTLRKTQEIPSGHNPADYVAKRLYAKAADGAEVPITVLMRKGTPLDGSAPLLLYGYGSYGASMDPNFSIRNLSLVDRGWIWATAHIRGGAEKGRGWFMDGRKFKKKNTFTDFIASAEHLIGKGYGAKGRIVAYGGSAGGLLMGAITNLRPDLWAGVIGAVPFVDVLNTMSDTSLPLTPPEWPEWGNPLTDPEAYDYILSYSPYDQVTNLAYPPVLATGGLSDPRVTYWEPAKWIAKLRDKSTSGAPMLLKINMEAGHGGSSGRYDFLKEIAFDYAFAVWSMARTKQAK